MNPNHAYAFLFAVFVLVVTLAGRSISTAGLPVASALIGIR